jgi:hypothetical protein
MQDVIRKYVKRKAPPWRRFTFHVSRFTIYASLLILVLCTFISGCGKMMGVLVGKTVGEDIPATYVPEKDQPMLVLAENYQNPGSTSIESEQLARYVCQGLERKKVAPQIDPSAAIDLRSRDPAAYRKMSITQVGQALGAKQVLYIALLSNSVDMAEATEFQRGEAAARVRVVDVDTGQTRWPIDASSGYPVTAKTPVVKVTDENSANALRRGLQERLGGDIARLFYKYKADEEGEGALGP